jgi:hypothetical protein
MNEGQELVKSSEAAIDLFEAFSDPLMELEEKNPKVKFDITTYEGETECKKYIAKVGKFRIGVEKLRVSLKKEFLEGGKAVDKKAKLYQERIAAIDAVHSVPLKELENKRIAEVLEAREAEQAEAKRIQDEKDAELEKLRKIVADQEAAAKAIEDEAQVLRDAAERKEELEAAALLAAERATFEAGQKAIEEVAAVKRQAKAEADAKAKEIADKYEAEQAEQRKIDAGILARQQDKEHRKDFNNAAALALQNITQDRQLSVDIVIAIVSGKIPNISINY